MNEPMNHRYEAALQPDGAWIVEELLGDATSGRALGYTKREAQHEAVRLNRLILRQEPDRAGFLATGA